MQKNQSVSNDFYQSENLELIQANWSAPDNIVAFTTTRVGGLSQFPYDSLNLASHVGDDIQIVEKNRKLFLEENKLPNMPIWLEQTHGYITLRVDEEISNRKADAAISFSPNIPCVILTADCVPILLCNKQGTKVAAVHAGWKGMLEGIIESSVLAMDCSPENCLAWIGPAIGPENFEIGPEVENAFINKDKECRFAFTVVNQKINGNLFSLAKFFLKKVGVKNCYCNEICTYNNKDQFFSYRRDGITGRMASVIWFR